jgi:hypothetical protein
MWQETRAWDPDGDGDDDSTPEGDTDHSHWTADGKQIKSVPGKPMPGQSPAPRAAKPYGNVAYADPKNGKYPIDTAAHAKAAWSYINMPKNAAKYPLNGVTLSSVKARIMAACKKFGIDVAQGNSAPPDGDRHRERRRPHVRGVRGGVQHPGPDQRMG